MSILLQDGLNFGLELCADRETGHETWSAWLATWPGFAVKKGFEKRSEAWAWLNAMARH